MVDGKKVKEVFKTVGKYMRYAYNNELSDQIKLTNLEKFKE